MSYTVVFAQSFAPSVPLQNLVTQNILQQVTPLNHPRMAKATWRGAQGIVLDAQAAADWLLPVSLAAVGQQITAIGLPTPTLQAIDDDIWWCAATPHADSLASQPALLAALNNADHTHFVTDNAARLFDDCMPLIHTVVPAVTGRPLPALATNELQAIIRGLAGALLNPAQPTLGNMATLCTFTNAQNKKTTGVLPLCVPRLSAAARDAVWSLTPPTDTAQGFFWWLTATQYLALAITQRHTSPQEQLWQALAQPIATLNVLQQWLARWVPVSLRVAIAN